MDEILKEKILERKIFPHLSEKLLVEFIDKNINHINFTKLMSLIVDIPDVTYCGLVDFKDTDLMCEFKTGKWFFLDRVRNDKDIKITIMNAESEVSQKDLESMGYKMTSYFEREGKKFNNADYEKVVSSDALETELLKYLNKLSEKKPNIEINILKERLEEMLKDRRE